MRGDKNSGFLNAIAPAAAAAAAIMEEFSTDGNCRFEGCDKKSLLIFEESFELSSFKTEFAAVIVCGGTDVIHDAAEDEPDDIVDAVDDGRTG